MNVFGDRRIFIEFLLSLIHAERYEDHLNAASYRIKPNKDVKVLFMLKYIRKKRKPRPSPAAS